MSDLTLHEQALAAALEVAILDALSDKVGTALKKARAAAEAVFAASGEGFPQVNVVLPDGRRVGRITVKETAPKAVPVSTSVLPDWCRDHYLDGLEEYVEQSAWTNTDVIDAVKAKVPGVVKTRLRATAAESLLAESLEADGWLLDKETGDTLKVADITESVITGEFAFTDKTSGPRRAAIVKAWQDGLIDIVPVLALTAASGDGEQAA